MKETSFYRVQSPEERLKPSTEEAKDNLETICLVSFGMREGVETE